MRPEFVLLGYLIATIVICYAASRALFVLLGRSKLATFFGLLFIGSLVTVLNVGPLGLILGFPSVLLASVLSVKFLSWDAV